MGVYIPFLYDWLRIFRRVIPHGSLWVSLEDFVFWIYCAAEVFLLMQRESQGTLRWFAIFGAAVGIWLYERLVGRYLVRLLSRFLSKIWKRIKNKLTYFKNMLKMTVKKLSAKWRIKRKEEHGERENSLS